MPSLFDHVSFDDFFFPQKASLCNSGDDWGGGGEPLKALLQHGCPRLPPWPGFWNRFQGTAFPTAASHVPETTAKQACSCLMSGYCATAEVAGALPV